jgi:3-methyladenine DNA glycosylase/8-oxoguanine DNA glycosylase
MAVKMAAMSANADANSRVVLDVDEDYDLALTMRGVPQTRNDPSIRITPQETWRATTTPLGHATIRYVQRRSQVVVQSWGPGSTWACDNAGDAIGLNDGFATFSAPERWLTDAHRQYIGMRITKTRNVFETLVGSILGQRVTGGEASRSWSQLVKTYGTRAPGPGDQLGLIVPPTGSQLATLTYEQFHPLGIERKRAEAIRLAARYAARLDALADCPMAEATRALLALRGVGIWTIAETSVRALGDTDALSVGDYHLKNSVATAFANKARGTDDEMVQLLERFRPHRARVVRLMQLAGPRTPRFGARYDPLPIASW